MPQLSALYGLRFEDLVDMPRAELDQYLWQRQQALTGWRES
jgi:hypothetical protein